MKNQNTYLNIFIAIAIAVVLVYFYRKGKRNKTTTQNKDTDKPKENKDNNVDEEINTTQPGICIIPPFVIDIETSGITIAGTTIYQKDKPEIAVDLFGKDKGQLEIDTQISDTVFTIETTANRISSIEVNDNADIELSEPYILDNGNAAIDFRIISDEKINKIRLTLN